MRLGEISLQERTREENKGTAGGRQDRLKPWRHPREQMKRKLGGRYAVL